MADLKKLLRTKSIITITKTLAEAKETGNRIDNLKQRKALTDLLTPKMDKQDLDEQLAMLSLHLSNERIRLGRAKTDGERALRQGWVRQLEKEIAQCEVWLSQLHDDLGQVDAGLSDDELLDALMA